MRNIYYKAIQKFNLSYDNLSEEQKKYIEDELKEEVEYGYERI
jgi:hypothetical protein